MSQSHLTHKYRPQTFADVAGQETIKAILSRAAATGAIAPAYMFSGTRGVGKTTIARIFAKAINCEKGPAAEPCNECLHCRQISAGAAVDVAEIDGASNTGVDDVRSLKEDVGFAPIDCRYKVFIIDEAHMLSKSAFNALLKTLEEPPSHVTFILATTEPHKFPQTIISRCQHYTFKRLTQKELEAHLTRILETEGKAFDSAAISLIARRGAGSVRDSMSLLGQVLALGGETLTADDVRTVLGLAGRDILFRLMDALHKQDCVGVSGIVAEILDQGLDLGFFMRELTEAWRTMFLLSQAGDKALAILDLPDEEAAQWKEWTKKFSMAHIHACWQLTIEGQQRVRQSLEPALALELLLLNLTYLPQLVGLEGAGNAGVPSAPVPAAGQGGAAQGTPPAGPASGAAPASGGAGMAPRQPQQNVRASRPAAPAQRVQAAAQSAPPQGGTMTAPRPQPARPAPQQRQAAPAARQQQGQGGFPPVPAGPKTWDNFLDYATQCKGATGRSINGIRHVRAHVGNGALILQCNNKFHCEQIKANSSYSFLQELVREYFGSDWKIEFQFQQKQRKNRSQIKDEMSEHPLVQNIVSEFDAQIMSAGPRTDVKQKA